jgi:hypothetical protein
LGSCHNRRVHGRQPSITTRTYISSSTTWKAGTSSFRLALSQGKFPTGEQSPPGTRTVVRIQPVCGPKTQPQKPIPLL